MSPPTDFDNASSNTSAAGRPQSLSRAFNNSLSLYRQGQSGPWRLLLEESFGYSVLELTSPASPRFIRWDDLRFDSNPIEQHGDGQSYLQTVAVAPDGQRAAFSVNGPAEPNWHTLVGQPDGNEGFGLWGDTAESRASGTVIQQLGARYVLYVLYSTSSPLAADITTLPAAVSSANLPHETTSWPPGTTLSLAGNFLVYMAGNAVQVLDASNPGPAGSITSGYPQLQLASTTVPDFGGRTPQYVSANVDPGDPNRLWLLVALGPLAGENSPSYGLVSISRSPTTGALSAPVSAGPAYRVPAAANETWVNVGPASALVSKNGTLFVLMWSNRRAPTYQFALFSTTANDWGSASGQAIVDPNFDGPGDSLYAYGASGDAWVIPMTCVRF